jgi:DNA polymerase V
MAKYLDAALDKIYKPNIGYKKAGIIVNNIIDDQLNCYDLFGNFNIKYDSLLPTIETIKNRYGKSSIQLALSKLSNSWLMKQKLMSRRYTTCIEELLEIT